MDSAAVTLPSEALDSLEPPAPPPPPTDCAKMAFASAPLVTMLPLLATVTAPASWPAPAEPPSDIEIDALPPPAVVALDEPATPPPPPTDCANSPNDITPLVASAPPLALVSVTAPPLPPTPPEPPSDKSTA